MTGLATPAALLAHKQVTEAASAAMVPPAPDQPPAGPDPVFVGGDADAGGRDTVAADPAGAVANAEARFGELQGDTYGQGSSIGDLVDLPGAPPPFEEMYFPETNQQTPGPG